MGRGCGWDGGKGAAGRVLLRVWGRGVAGGRGPCWNSFGVLEEVGKVLGFWGGGAWQSVGIALWTWSSQGDSRIRSASREAA